jgi:hypothetical protein
VLLVVYAHSYGTAAKFSRQLGLFPRY